MNRKTLLRYSGGTVLLFAMLLPLTSQADVIWSIRLGQGLYIDRDYHPRYERHERYEANRRAHRYERREALHEYYSRHRARARGFYDNDYRYKFTPRYRAEHRHRYHY